MEGLHTAITLPQRFLQCSLCKKTVNKPKLLSCLHSYCQSCLRDFFEAKKGEFEDSTKGRRWPGLVSCPECQTEIRGPEYIAKGKDMDAYVNTFPENTFLDRMVKTVSSLTKREKDCDICVRIGKTADAALNWCCDCYEALCESCTEVHQCTAVTSDHEILSLNSAKQNPLTLLLNRKHGVACKDHKGETVKLFCPNCSVTLCAQCVTDEHKLCGKCVTISDAFKTHEDELDALSGKLDTVQRFVTEAKNVLTEENESFSDRIESIRDEIKGISKNLRQRIQESEQELLSELDRWRLQTEPELMSGVTKMGECGERVQKTRDVIDTLLQYGSDSEIMSSLALIRQQTQQTEKSAYRDVATHHKQPDISFQQSRVTMEFFQDFETLGDIRFNEGVTENGCDQFSCWGITCVSREYMIVVDGNNKALHKFRRGGSLIDQIAVSDEPRDVTHIGCGDIAVTLNRKQIMFLSTTGKIKLKQTMKTQKSYHSIAKLGSTNLAVSYLGGGKSVDIITMTGDILRTLSMDEQGKPLFFEPRYLETTKGDNPLILVSDFRQQSIIGLTPDGKVKFKFQTTNGHRALNPLGICADRFGNIFVADYSKDEIVLLTGEGKYQRSVVSREDEVDRPVAIDISRDGRLVVLQNDGMVRVFSY